VDGFGLGGKVAVVTGGSRGLGRAIVLGLAAAGADVVIASRKVDACRAVAAEVEAAGRRALAVACHVGVWDDLTRLVAATVDRFGRIDVLVNNAGMSPLYDSPETVSEELFDKVIAVNLKGPYRLSALVGARMAAGEGGAIVNISSVSAIRPTPAELPYAAAKAGLNALTTGLAQAYGPAVRVNAIMCGPFRTDVSRHWDTARMEATVRATQAIGRVGEPDEVVGAVLYLASPLASYTTGATLRVDGGRI
jgi:NAD(P)-dependent dehydrogenase (short-subunit alcohol dehydrogenase family)